MSIHVEHYINKRIKSWVINFTFHVTRHIQYAPIINPNDSSLASFHSILTNSSVCLSGFFFETEIIRFYSVCGTENLDCLHLNVSNVSIFKMSLFSLWLFYIIFRVGNFHATFYIHQFSEGFFVITSKIIY